MQTNQPEKDSRHSRTFSSNYQIMSEMCYCIRGERNTRIVSFKRALMLLGIFLVKQGQRLLLKLSGSFGERGMEALEIDPLRRAEMLSLMFSCLKKKMYRERLQIRGQKCEL